VRKINPELWLLLFLVVIAAMLNFLVASQRMALVFYFLPTMYSAYHFGRRHATLTAVASIVLVVLLVSMNPAMFRRHVEIPLGLWFDLTVWGGVLMVAGYATGTLYEHNQKSLREMEEGYDGMLVILQNFLANQKYSETHAYRISMCATTIAEQVGLDGDSIEDIRTAALLFNMHVTTAGGGEIVFPTSDADLKDELSRLLFRMSSPLPAHLAEFAGDKGYEIADGSRGFIFNGDPQCIVDFFEIGTRPKLVADR